jgi:hypothetical protein
MAEFDIILLLLLLLLIFYFIFNHPTHTHTDTHILNTSANSTKLKCKNNTLLNKFKNISKSITTEKLKVEKFKQNKK